MAAKTSKSKTQQQSVINSIDDNLYFYNACNRKWYFFDNEDTEFKEQYFFDYPIVGQNRAFPSGGFYYLGYDEDLDDNALHKASDLGLQELVLRGFWYASFEDATLEDFSQLSNFRVDHLMRDYLDYLLSTDQLKWSERQKAIKEFSSYITSLPQDFDFKKVYAPEMFLLAVALEDASLDIRFYNKINLHTLAKQFKYQIDEQAALISLFYFEYPTVYKNLIKHQSNPEEFWKVYAQAKRLPKDILDPLLKKFDFTILEQISNFEAKKLKKQLPQIIEMLDYVNTKPVFTTNLAKEFAQNFDGDQLEALKTIDNSNVTLLLGRAGTGKSHVVSTIYNHYHRKGLHTVIVTPTGKAAVNLHNRLSDGDEDKTKNITTLHSYFRWFGDGPSFMRRSKNEIREYYNPPNVLIFEEISMLDENALFYALANIDMKHIKKIIFLGDQNQLPAINPASKLMAYLVNQKRFAITELTTNRRVSGSNGYKIVQWNDNLLAGRFNLTNAADKNEPTKIIKTTGYWSASKPETFTRQPKMAGDVKVQDCIDQTKMAIGKLYNTSASFGVLAYKNDDITYLNRQIATYLADNGITKKTKSIIARKSVNGEVSQWNLGDKIVCNKNMRVWANVSLTPEYKAKLEQEKSGLQPLIEDGKADKRQFERYREIIATLSNYDGDNSFRRERVVNGSFWYLQDFEALLHQKSNDWKGMPVNNVDLTATEIDANIETDANRNRKRTDRLEFKSLTLVDDARRKVYKLSQAELAKKEDNILKYLDLGYASTIHKFQGSQADYIFYFFNHSPYKDEITGNWGYAGGSVQAVYTAMSRAQVKAYFIGNHAWSKTVAQLGDENAIRQDALFADTAYLQELENVKSEISEQEFLDQEISAIEFFSNKFLLADQYKLPNLFFEDYISDLYQSKKKQLTKTRGR